MDAKVCTTCGVEKPLSAYRQRSKNRTRVSGESYVYTYYPNVCAGCEDQDRMAAARTDDGRRQRQTANAKYENTLRGWLARMAHDYTVRGGRHAPELTEDEWLALLDRYQGRCAYCRRPLTGRARVGDPSLLVLDHVVPVASGGRHDHRNVVPSCWSCNSKKGQRIWGPRLPITAAHPLAMPSPAP